MADRNSGKFPGAGNLVMAATFSGSVRIPCSLTMCPRNFISATPNTHFFGFRYIPCFRKSLKTSMRALTWADQLGEHTVTSSRYTKTSFFDIKGPRILFIIRWNDAGALQSPKGIRRYSHCPSVATNALFSTARGVSPICWYPDKASRLEWYLVLLGKS